MGIKTYLEDKEIETEKGRYSLMAGVLKNEGLENIIATSLVITGDTIVDDKGEPLALACLSKKYGADIINGVDAYRFPMYGKISERTEEIMEKCLHSENYRPKETFITSCFSIRKILTESDKNFLHKLRDITFDPKIFQYSKLPLIFKFLTRETLTPKEVKNMNLRDINKPRKELIKEIRKSHYWKTTRKKGEKIRLSPKNQLIDEIIIDNAVRSDPRYEKAYFSKLGESQSHGEMRFNEAKRILQEEYRKKLTIDPLEISNPTRRFRFNIDSLYDSKAMDSLLRKLDRKKFKKGGGKEYNKETQVYSYPISRKEVPLGEIMLRDYFVAVQKNKTLKELASKSKERVSVLSLGWGNKTFEVDPEGTLYKKDYFASCEGDESYSRPVQLFSPEHAAYNAWADRDEWYNCPDLKKIKNLTENQIRGHLRENSKKTLENFIKFWNDIKIRT